MSPGEGHSLLGCSKVPVAELHVVSVQCPCEVKHTDDPERKKGEYRSCGSKKISCNV